MRGPEFYDKQYFDGKGSKSGYTHYGHRLTFDARYALAALHTGIGTMGSLFPFQKATIVDLGGATGLFVSWLKKFMPQAHIFNTDWSEYAMKNALPEVRKYTFRSDIQELPIRSESCDLVLCIDVLEHLDEKAIPAALSEIRRIMKCGSKAVLVPNIGEDSETSVDQSHVSIRSREWWVAEVEKHGLRVRDTSSRRLIRSIARQKFCPFIPTVRPGLIIAETA